MGEGVPVLPAVWLEDYKRQADKDGWARGASDLSFFLQSTPRGFCQLLAFLGSAKRLLEEGYPPVQQGCSSRSLLQWKAFHLHLIKQGKQLSEGQPSSERGNEPTLDATSFPSPSAREPHCCSRTLLQGQHLGTFRLPEEEWEATAKQVPWTSTWERNLLSWSF